MTVVMLRTAGLALPGLGDLRLAAGQRAQATPGALLSFARESPAWTLVDTRAPADPASAGDRARREAGTDILRCPVRNGQCYRCTGRC